MSDVSRALRLTRIGSFTLLLVLAWFVPGCRQATTSQGTTVPATTGEEPEVRLLDDPPIRVKNQELAVELFNGDVWKPFGITGNQQYKPENKVKTSDYLGVIALTYGGDDYCEGQQPIEAKSVTIEYGQPGTGTPKRQLTFKVDTSDKKVIATFPGANGQNTKKLYFSDTATDHIRRVVVDLKGGGQLKCPKNPSSNPETDVLVYLY